MKFQSRRSSSNSTEKSSSERKLSSSRRSSPSPVSNRSKSVFCEAQIRKIQNEKEYEIGRMKQVRMRELRVKQEEERLISTFEEKELKAEEDKLKQLKRERLKREKILYAREKKVLKMKEEQLRGDTRTVPFELDRPWTHRTVARDESICRVITKYPANEEKRSACTSSSRDKRDESVGSSCSLHTSSSRSVFEGNRLGEKISAKKRLGIRRRSSSRSAKKRLGIRKRSRSSSRY